jgi:hypothetical protein
MPMNTNNKKGFTLVELIVSIGLFTTVIFVAMSSLLNVLSVYRVTEASREVMDNLDFALSTMTQKLRIGFDYHCGESILIVPLDKPVDCPITGEPFVSFTDMHAGGILSAYRMIDGRIEHSIDCFPTGCGNWQVLSAPEIEVEDLTFYVDGALRSSQSTDTQQPRILITLKGLAGIKEREQVDFNIQTFVSQRVFDSP